MLQTYIMFFLDSIKIYVNIIFFYILITES